MHQALSRRKFITSLGLITASSSLPACFAAKAGSGNIVPGMKLGYSAITWSGNDVQAIKDIAALGFKGIQLRSNILKEYGSKPEVIRDLLVQYKLALPMFSSGNANINTGNDQSVIDMHVSNARFVKALGGENMQVTNSSRPKTGTPTTEDLKSYARLINEIGKRTLDVGVQTNYHNHMGQLGQTPEEVEVILDNTDSNNIKFLLDIAHYRQGGGDPVNVLNRYKDRIRALHLKDVRDNTNGDKGYTFVELGQGKVNLPGFFNALDDIKFKGWGIVELDAVPEKDKTPTQCANITKSYLQSLKVQI